MQQYIHQKSQKIVTIISEDDHFYNLSNNSQILKDLFMATYTPLVEDNSSTVFNKPVVNNVVNPDDFFEAGVNTYVNLLNNTSSVNEPTIVAENLNIPKMSPEEYERYQQQQADLITEQKKRDLMAQHNLNNNIQSPKTIINTADFLTEDELPDFNQQNNRTGNRNIPQPPKVENSIFLKLKRNFDVKINLTFDELITEPSSLKMFMNIFDGDIIDFYATELVNKITFDLPEIKKKIYEQFDIIINGEKKPIKQQKVSKPRIKKVKSDIDLKKEEE